MKTQLFSPYTLRGVTFDNRIVVSPMVQFSADNRGNAGDWHMVHFGNLALSGAGLVFTEATGVEPRGVVTDHCLGLWSDENEESFARTMAFCRANSRAKLGIQLQHSGRKGSVSAPWEKLREMTPETGGWKVVAPSPLPYPGKADIPEPLSIEALATLKQNYVDAAKRAERLGYEVLEIHSAHGYLLHQFLSPLSNKREDAYGGDLEGRMRFPLEVFAAVREVWPEDRVLGVRISATDWIPGGWDLEQSVTYSAKLKDLGCDYITASSGGLAPEQKITVVPGYQVPFAEAIRRDVGIPTMAIGLITDPFYAEEILTTGKADFIAMARGILFNPRWPWLAAHMLGEDESVYYPPQYERAHPAMQKGDFLKPYREKAAAD